jgi:hypothetical protein
MAVGVSQSARSWHLPKTNSLVEVRYDRSSGRAYVVVGRECFGERRGVYRPESQHERGQGYQSNRAVYGGHSIERLSYLAVALVAMGVSLAAQVSGQPRWGNFIAQWVPTWLLFGLYNKLVKLEGHDREDRGIGRT